MRMAERIGASDGEGWELDEVVIRLRPGVNRRLAIEQLDELFRRGREPDPDPNGFVAGSLVVTTIWRPLDALVRSITDLWMPWKGKSFHPESSSGVNQFTPGGRRLLKLWFPRYQPERIEGDRVDVFPFRTWVAPGTLDPDVLVLKIDYDFEPNPRFIVRSILDEVVQVADDRYLGKILFRVGRSHHLIGFFTLRAPRRG